MRVVTLCTLWLVACTAAPAFAAGTLVGTWRHVWASEGKVNPGVVEISANSAGYQILEDGVVNDGFTGDGRRVSRMKVLTLEKMREVFDRVPEPVRRQAQGQVFTTLTLILDSSGDRFTLEYAKGTIYWMRDRFDHFEPNTAIVRDVYERVGPAPGSGALRLTDAGSGVFTCYVADGQRSGCLDVRNKSSRRIRVYLVGAPGVLCTVDPGVYCSVPIPFGEHGVRVEPDDEQGIGPAMNTRITMGASGVRLAVEGDVR